MLYEEDWIMRQIAGIVRVIAKLMFGKDLPAYFAEMREEHNASDGLRTRLTSLLAQGRVNEAENLLFEEADPENKAILAVALDFYDRLNAMSQSELHRCGFSRQEVQSGLADICAVYGIDPMMVR